LIVGFCFVMTRRTCGWNTIHPSLGSMIVM